MIKKKKLKIWIIVSIIILISLIIIIKKTNFQSNYNEISFDTICLTNEIFKLCSLKSESQGITYTPFNGIMNEEVYFYKEISGKIIWKNKFAKKPSYFCEGIPPFTNPSNSLLEEFGFPDDILFKCRKT